MTGEGAPRPVSARPPSAKPGTKPTPVRSAEQEEPRTEISSDVAEVSLVLGGAERTVRVLGKSGGAGATPLMLLGFWDSESESETPEVESTVVGRMLSTLSEERLEDAFRQGRPPQPEDRPRRFFPEGRGGRPSKGGRKGGRSD